MPLIESINEAVENAKEFNRLSMNSDSTALQNFSRFFHWYYFSNLDIFAPSKFIGYQNTTIENYDGTGTGTATQRVLNQWFEKIQTTSPYYKQLRVKLEVYGQNLGKKRICIKTFEGTGGIYLLSKEYAISYYPDEVEGDGYSEGATKQVYVNAYERNPLARQSCIKHWGTKCYVCSFDFKEKYGNIGEGFIHVHHIRELHSINEEYEVDPITDLCPICPNCHAMLHRKKPAIHPDKLKELLENA